MQPLDPLAVLHIALASRHILGLTRIGENHRESPLFQNLEDWNPVNPRRLHRYAGDPAFLEPIGQRVQIGGKGAETSDVLWRRLGRHTGKVLFSADVDAGCLGINRLPALINGYFLLFLFGFWS